MKHVDGKSPPYYLLLIKTLLLLSHHSLDAHASRLALLANTLNSNFQHASLLDGLVVMISACHSVQ